MNRRGIRTQHHVVREIGDWIVRLSGSPASYRLDLIRDIDGYELTATVSRGRKWENMRGQFDLFVRLEPSILRQIFDSIPIKQKRELPKQTAA